MYFCSLKINFVFTISADPDEMPHDAAFHLVALFAKGPVRGSSLQRANKQFSFRPALCYTNPNTSLNNQHG